MRNRWLAMFAVLGLGACMASEAETPGEDDQSSSLVDDTDAASAAAGPTCVTDGPPGREEHVVWVTCNFGRYRLSATACNVSKCEVLVGNIATAPNRSTVNAGGAFIDPRSFRITIF